MTEQNDCQRPYAISGQASWPCEESSFRAGHGHMHDHVIVHVEVQVRVEVAGFFVRLRPAAVLCQIIRLHWGLGTRCVRIVFIAPLP